MAPPTCCSSHRPRGANRSEWRERHCPGRPGRPDVDRASADARPSPATPSKPPAGRALDIPATTSHTITGLTNGTAYQFRVCAITRRRNRTGLRLEHRGDPAPAACGSSGVERTARDAQVDLTWTPPGDNGGATITGYRIESSGRGRALGHPQHH